MLDVSNGGAFSLLRLTSAINEVAYVPSRIQELGLFSADYLDVTVLAIEQDKDILAIIPPTPRGGPGTTIEKNAPLVRSLTIPHFEIKDGVKADEVQNKRAFGTENQLRTVMSAVAKRQRIHVNSFALTEEVARLGAIKGEIVYQGVDGKPGPKLDLFAEFGVTKPEAIALGIAAATDGALRKICADITRKMIEALGGLPFTGIRAFCGDNVFDGMIGSKEVRDTYKGWSEAQILRDSYIGPNKSTFGSFLFGGILWENYRGATNSPTAIDKDSFHAFPEGVPELFKTAYAPADYNETVNTEAVRLYSKMRPTGDDKGYHLDAQMNCLQYCTRPKVLLNGTK